MIEGSFSLLLLKSFIANKEMLINMLFHTYTKKINQPNKDGRCL